MRPRLVSSLCLMLMTAVALPAAAQAPAPPLGGGRALNQMYTTLKTYLTESANKMAEADFAFKPAPDVRTYGQLIGHVSNAGFASCAGLLGEANPNKENLEQKTGKAALSAALASMVAYCDRAFASITDENVVEPITLGQRQVARMVPAASLVSHLNEHYGNLVTYMRIKGVVPPSTERAMRR